jgi:ketosteroid isomerase-like protein
MTSIGKYLLAAVTAAGLAWMAMAPAVGIVTQAAAAEQSAASLEADGMAAIKAWWGALVAGTPASVGAVLAPEFQIMRADGSGYDKAGYLASSLPKIAAMPEVTKLVVTEHGDTLVTRYYVTVEETRNGKTVERHAPRMTIFRKEGDSWLVVAHGNFATLEK